MVFILTKAMHMEQLVAMCFYERSFVIYLSLSGSHSSVITVLYIILLFGPT